MMPDSMEGSGNSTEENQKQLASNSEDIFRESARKTRRDNNVQQEGCRLQDDNHTEDRSIRGNQDVAWTGRTGYRSVPKVDGAEKKWWRLLKWLPGLKSFRFSRRSTAPEVHGGFDETGNPREEMPMTVWDIRDDNEQRPV